MATKRPPSDEMLALYFGDIAAEGVTTLAGNGTGTSFIDAALAGAGAGSYFPMLAILYVGDTRRIDSRETSGFNTGNGEVTLASAYKGVAAAIPAGVRYQIRTGKPSSDAVAAVLAKVTNLPAVDVDGVYLDQAAGEAGTTFPIGTPTRPVLTIADALTICTARKLKKIYVYGNLALTQSIPNTRAVIGIPVSDLPTLTWNGFSASGRNYNFRIAVDSPVSTGTFIDCRVIGNKVAPSTCENLSVVQGFKFLNGLGGYSISFRPYFGFADTALTINVNGETGEDFLVSLEPCDVTITNMTQVGYILHLKMNGGIVRVAASCNAGATSELWLQGEAQVIVDPAATITIYDHTSGNPSKLSYVAVVTGIVGAPNFQCRSLADFRNDFFEGWYAYVVWDAAGGGGAPQGQQLICTGYVSATGDFTVAAFAPAIAVGDKVLLIHPSIANMLGLGPLSVVSQPGVAARTNLGAILTDLADILAGTAGITNFPAAAAAANGVSIAEVVRYIQENLVAPTVAGNLQPKPTTFDLNQAANTYTLFTGTTQDVSLKTFKIRMTGGALAAPFTYFSVQTDDTTPQVILSAIDGAVANLTDQNQLFWNGDILIKAGKKIQLTIAVAFAGAARVSDVVAECRAVVSGGYLAP